MNKLELQKIAVEIRKNILIGVHAAKAGHPGGSMSAADILAYLYFEELNVDPKNPKWEDRDRFVLSKGHAAPGLYSALGLKGFFPIEDIATLRKLGSYLQGHPCIQYTPGIDMSTGSLGQGISAATGMALAGKMDKKDYRVYSLLGDGEIEEGQVWEAAMFAGFHKLDNLTIIVDNNFDVSETLVLNKIVKSKNEFRRLIIQGGVKVNGVKVESIDNIEFETEITMQIGKKKFIRLKKR